MRRRIFLYFCILIVTVACIMGVAAYTISRGSYERELTSSMLSQIDLFSRQIQGDVASQAEEYVEAFVTTRITIIDADGNVLYDTEVSEPGNHRDRPEVAAAFETGTGVSKRFSDSTWQPYLYVAKRVPYGGGDIVVRFSVGMDYLTDINHDLLLYLLAAVAGAAGVALVLSMLFTKKIVQPVRALSDYARAVSGGDMDAELHYRPGGELGELARSVKVMQRRLKRALRKEQAKNAQLHAILNSTAGGILALDTSGVILLINRRAVEMLELAREDAVGKELFAVCRDKQLGDFIRASKPGTMEYEHRGRSFSVSQSPITDDMGNALGVVAVLQDVTEVKRLLNVRSEFASNVSHELKTPLTSIRGFVDTLKNGAIGNPAAAERFLDIIEIETERLTSLINDILEISALESAQPEQQPEQCNVDTVAAEVEELVEHTAAKKNVTVSYRNDTGRSEYPIGHDRLKQLLINLVSNAIQYNREGGRVDIVVEQADDTWRLRVSDTGIGIEPEDQPRIFERFYRVDKGRSRQNGGTGLGLSIVKHIAHIYGGTVRVESTPGQGSEFIVELPLQ